ncbi:protein phosphatase inhibitor [Ostertagia ostertagi]
MNVKPNNNIYYISYHSSILSIQELVLRLSREPERPHVNWTTDTVDNENLGKKKSKCCCIYKKKKTWQDSSSSDDSVSGKDNSSSSRSVAEPVERRKLILDIRLQCQIDGYLDIEERDRIEE